MDAATSLYFMKYTCSLAPDRSAEELLIALTLCKLREEGYGKDVCEERIECGVYDGKVRQKQDGEKEDGCNGSEEQGWAATA